MIKEDKVFFSFTTGWYCHRWNEPVPRTTLGILGIFSTHRRKNVWVKQFTDLKGGGGPGAYTWITSNHSLQKNSLANTKIGFSRDHLIPQRPAWTEGNSSKTSPFPRSWKKCFESNWFFIFMQRFGKNLPKW